MLILIEMHMIETLSGFWLVSTRKGIFTDSISWDFFSTGMDSCI